MSKIQAIRGMNDILPEQSLTWHYFERKFRQVVKEFGYQEIRFPVLEQTQLFKRSIGEVTDIVEKEMYSFDDRNGDNLSLRPEGTAGCVRAANQHGLLYNQQQRLWYQGAMFRHERPQKGRYRQFHQFGVEAFGMVGPDIDAEIIQLSHKLWAELDLHDYLQLEINNIGSADDRKAYSAALTEFLSARAELLDDDARRRMHSNPLRVLDSKNPDVQSALQGAPVLADYVSDESKQHFASLCEYLDDLGVAYNLNPRLVRGLDYYNYCVFEWTTEQLGAQGAVCGGGRYDGLVAQLGGRATPAAGFAIGIERIVLMLDGLEKVPAADLKPIDIYVLAVGQGVQGSALHLAASLRERYPGFGVISHCGGGKYNSQLKRAFACGARIAVVLEQDSETTDSAPGAKLRRLDDSGESVTVELSEVAERLDEFLGNSDS